MRTSVTFTMWLGETDHSMRDIKFYSSIVNPVALQVAIFSIFVCFVLRGLEKELIYFVSFIILILCLILCQHIINFQ